MLYAELHGKLDPETTNLARSEDVLTSTTFGTLLIAAGGIEVLTGWLNCARALGEDNRLSRAVPEIEEELRVDYWFWPSLAEAIPDLVLRLGDRLLNIEVKYLSAKGQESEQNHGSSKDQLARQWRSCQPTALSETYHPQVATAIEECTATLIYLVSTRHIARALDEVRTSEEILRREGHCDVRIYLLTWQDLHRELTVLRGRQCSQRWIADLADLMARRPFLSAFVGFPRTATASQHSLDGMASWSDSWTRDGVGGFTGLDLPVPLDRTGLAAMASWCGYWTRAQ